MISTVPQDLNKELTQLKATFRDRGNAVHTYSDGTGTPPNTLDQDDIISSVWTCLEGVYTVTYTYNINGNILTSTTVFV